MADYDREEFERRSRPISDAVLKHLQAVVPRTWPVAMHQLDVSFSPVTGTRSIKHRLWNPVTDEEVRDFPEALFQATTALHAIFVEYDQAWTRCLLIYRPGPRIDCVTYYHYGFPT